MDDALEKLRKINSKVDGILMNLKSFDSVKTASEVLRQRVKHIDILILNVQS